VEWWRPICEFSLRRIRAVLREPVIHFTRPYFFKENIFKKKKKKLTFIAIKKKTNALSFPPPLLSPRLLSLSLQQNFLSILRPRHIYLTIKKPGRTVREKAVSVHTKKQKDKP
jgi:hypothetical protein